MSLSGLLIFLILANAWALLLFTLVRTGWLQRFNLALFGPALMIKTTRGQGLLEFLARAKKTFHVFAAAGLYLTGFVMAAMALLLVLQALVVFQIPPSAAPSPALILGIPGVNPIIPLGYGAIALIFAVVVHELAHGVLSRVQGIPVRTMGVLLLIIPIGAFVEPDESALRAAPRRVRAKVFAAGPTTNLAFAIVFALFFSPLLMAQAHAAPGAPIGGVESTMGRPNPACTAGLLPGWVITGIDLDRSSPGIQDIRNRVDFTRILNTTRAGQTLDVFVRGIEVVAPGAAERCPNATNVQAQVFPVTMVACHQQYGNESCLAQGQVLAYPDPLNRSVMGVRIYDVADDLEVMVHPFKSPAHFLRYVSLPFFALVGQFPLADGYHGFYDVPGSASAFWMTANLLYWLFWINLMLGLTNALPILPLDGGHLFRDWVAHRMDRAFPKWTPERRDAATRRISLWVTFVLLGLVLLQFVGPRIAGLFL